MLGKTARCSLFGSDHHGPISHNFSACRSLTPSMIFPAVLTCFTLLVPDCSYVAIPHNFITMRHVPPSLAVALCRRTSSLIKLSCAPAPNRKPGGRSLHASTAQCTHGCDLIVPPATDQDFPCSFRMTFHLCHLPCQPALASFMIIT